MTKITNKKILIFAMTMIMVNILAISAARAGTFWNMQQGMGATTDGVGAAFGQTTGTPTDLSTIIALIIKSFLGLLGVIFVVLMVWAGFKWMTSQGNESTVTEAKSMLRAATIGLIIILMSYSVATYVTTCFYGVTTGDFASWICVP
jgi:hypothetical protein